MQALTQTGIGRGYRNLRTVLLLVLGVVLQSSQLEAGQITWRSLANQPHVSSADVPLTQDFIFELGSFSRGFTPSLANTSQWAAEWHLASRVVFNSYSSLFSSKYLVTSNEAPFSTVDQGYIWGYNINDTASEWILITNPAWTWPSASGVGFPEMWATFNATETIVGTLGDDSDPFHLKTASVPSPSPVLSAEVWRQTFFSAAQLSDEAISGWYADSDGDGYDNIVEYALGGDPLVVTPNLNLKVKDLPDGLRQVDLQRLPNRLVALSFAVSYNLSTWFEDLDSSMVIVRDNKDVLSIQFPAGRSDKVFLRVDAALIGEQ